jgi:ABC-type Fe3+/spermidine/putrescine transport system ATPase subunit
MLVLDAVSFSYQTVKVIDSISLSIEKGQNLAIIGESGCGKSTLLQLIYGIHDLNKGAISWNDIPILGPKFNLIPGPPFMKYLAQDFNLMPYVTVAENVGKFLSNIHPEKKAARVSELLETVGMTEFKNIKAQYLSGGQQQRVAIAKVLALEPEVLLLDEPFSHIDNFKKNELRRDLFAYLREKKITCIVATHDRDDALSFCEETMVIQHGKVVQYGASKSVYLKPINTYVAALYGEVNNLKLDWLQKTNDLEKRILVYAHELTITHSSNLEVTVIAAFFKGTNYLIKAVKDEEIVFFESSKLIEEQHLVFLTVDSQTIQMRL